MVPELHPWSSPRFKNSKKKSRCFLKKCSLSVIAENLGLTCSPPSCKKKSSAALISFSLTAESSSIVATTTSFSFASSLSSIATITYASSAHSAGLITGSSLSEISDASAESSSLFLMHDSSKNSVARLEWKSSPDPFIFGSFESVDPLEKEKVSPASLSGEASSCLSSNSIEISASEGRIASVGVDDVVVVSPHLHSREEVMLKLFSLSCGDFSFFSLGGSLHGFVYRTDKAMYGRCGVLHHTREVFDVWCHPGIQELVSSNSTVYGYICASDANSAFMMFDEMTKCVSPAFSLVNILPATAPMDDSLLRKEAHKFSVGTGSVVVPVLTTIGNHVFGAQHHDYEWNNLVSGFTFICAVVFRMEQSDWSRSSSLAKSLGTVVSNVGAVILRLYKGPVPENSSQQPVFSQNSNWILGGLFLVVNSVMVVVFQVECELQQKEDDGHPNFVQDREDKSDDNFVFSLSKGVTELKYLQGHLDCITGLAIGGAYLFSSSFDKIVRVWFLQDFFHLHTFRGHENKAMALVYVDDEEPLCISGAAGFGVLLKEQGVKSVFCDWVPTLLGYSAQSAYKVGFYEFYSCGVLLKCQLMLERQSARTTLFLISFVEFLSWFQVSIG